MQTWTVTCALYKTVACVGLNTLVRALHEMWVSMCQFTSRQNLPPETKFGSPPLASRDVSYEWGRDLLAHHVITDDQTDTVVARPRTFQRVVDLVPEHRQILCKPATITITSMIPARLKALKIDVFDYHTVVWCPLCWKPRRIFAQTLYCQKLESLGYIIVTDSMGLSSFKFSWWAPKDACTLIQSTQWPSRSYKVADFGTDRKRVCDFLLVIKSNLGRILPHFRDIAERSDPAAILAV